MKKYLSLLFMLLIAASSDAQFSATLTSQCSYGGSDDEFLPAFVKTTDGGFVVASWSASGDKDLTGNKGSYDFWVFKTNSNGDIVWQKNYGGSSRDQSYGIIALKNGGYLVSGHTLSTDMDVTNNHGVQDGMLMKLDNSGNLIWLKCFGGSYEDELYSVVETDDGKFIAAGYSNSVDGQVAGNHGDKDVWIIKTDSNGNLLWQKSYGGSGTEEGMMLCKATTANNFFITGYSNSTNGDITGNKGSADGFILKIDSSGAILNTASAGGTQYDGFSAIAPTSEGGCVVTGYTQSVDGDIAVNKGGRDVWYAKFNASAGLQWSKTFGGTSSDYGNSILQLTDGSYVMTGNSASNDSDITGNKGANDILIALIKSNGNLKGLKCFGGSFSEYGSSVIAEGSDNYAVICNTASNNGDITQSKGGNDLWLIHVHATAPSVGINTTSQSTLSVYPNPANQSILVSGGLQAMNVPYAIYSMQGEMVLSGILPRQTATIDVAALSNGLYLLRTETGTTKFYIQK